jgi:hypothetical protein
VSIMAGMPVRHPFSLFRCFDIALLASILKNGGTDMADRKQFENVPVADSKLIELLKETKAHIVSEAELREQRISFAYGNAPADSTSITKESVRHASKNIKLSA